MSNTKFRVFKLRNQKEEELLKGLTDLKGELSQLRIAKISGGSASKVGRIGVHGCIYWFSSWESESPSIWPWSTNNVVLKSVRTSRRSPFLLTCVPRRPEPSEGDSPRAKEVNNSKTFIRRQVSQIMEVGDQLPTQKIRPQELMQLMNPYTYITVSHI